MFKYVPLEAVFPYINKRILDEWGEPKVLLTLITGLRLLRLYITSELEVVTVQVTDNQFTLPINNGIEFIAYTDKLPENGKEPTLFALNYIGTNKNLINCPGYNLFCEECTPTLVLDDNLCNGYTSMKEGYIIATIKKDKTSLLPDDPTLFKGLSEYVTAEFYREDPETLQVSMAYSERAERLLQDYVTKNKIARHDPYALRTHYLRSNLNFVSND